MTITPTNVRELHERLTGEIAEPIATTERDGVIELRFPQKLRAVAAGAIFAECRPSFTEEDEEYIGYILSQLAGWALYGEAYDPDSTPESLAHAAAKVVVPRGAA